MLFSGQTRKTRKIEVLVCSLEISRVLQVAQKQKVQLWHVHNNYFSISKVAKWKKLHGCISNSWKLLEGGSWMFICHIKITLKATQIKDNCLGGNWIGNLQIFWLSIRRISTESSHQHIATNQTKQLRTLFLNYPSLLWECYILPGDVSKKYWVYFQWHP